MPLSNIEKRIIYRLFDIQSGYVFFHLSDKRQYNKNDTRDIILDACNINIYSDPEYSSLSQQKCIEKIFETDDSHLIAALLKGLCDFFCFKFGNMYWDNEDQADYNAVQQIIKRLAQTEHIDLPEVKQYDNIEMLTQDIERNIQNGTPQLALDRLHTFSSIYLREKCKKHNLATSDEKGNNYSIDGLAGKLKKYYLDNSYCKSQFSAQAVKTMISLFANYNDIRNDHSFAHENDILAKDEAEFAVKTMLATLQFIDKLESTIDTLPF